MMNDYMGTVSRPLVLG